MEPSHTPAPEYLSDNPPHANGGDYFQGNNLLRDLKLRLDVETRQSWELANELKTKNERIGDQSRTIIRLREELSQAKQELDKERVKSSELQHNLEEEQGQRVQLKKRMAQFEKFIMQGAKTLFGRNIEEESSTYEELSKSGEGEGVVGTVQSPSSASSVRMPTLLPTPTQQPNYTIQEGTVKMSPQTTKYSLKRKNDGQKVQVTTQQQNIINERGKLIIPPKPTPVEQVPEASTQTQNPTAIQMDTLTLPPAPQESQSDAQPELPPLPPLVFQFQSTQLKMGMFSEGDPQTLKNASGSESTPFVVGLTFQGQLKYGDEVISIRNLKTGLGHHPDYIFEKVWWVAKQLIKCGNSAWSATPVVRDGKKQMITVEFLIGFVVKKLKSHVEKMMNGICSTAVITVPFWNSSSQRIQMKDGVRLAGFNKVFLINEGPASTFACPSRDRMISTSHNILVLSENSHQIDASIYSYNSYTSGAKRFIMIGHSGHYSQVDTLTGGAEPPKTGERSGLEEAIVQQLCTLALKDMDDKRHNPVGDTSPPLELITISESKIWAPILEQVGKQFVTTFHNLDVDNEKAVLMGAALLSRKPEEIQTLISDKLAHDVLAKCDNDQSKISIIPKENVLGIGGNNITHTFPGGCHFFKIFQTVLDRPIELFRMALLQPIAPTERMTITLTVTNEGVVKFKGLAYTSTSHKACSMKKARIEDYSWKAPNLSLGSLLKAKALVEYFAEFNEDESDVGPNTNIDSESKDVKEPSIGESYPPVDIAEKPIPTMEQIREQMVKVAKGNLSYMRME